MEIERLIVTGGAGFIGSNFVRRMLGRHEALQVTVLDKMTYAGNRANLADLAADPRLRVVEGDICDERLVDDLAGEAQAIVNFAAESHVDRSIEAPGAFIQTDVYGTYVLLDAARRHGHRRFVQIGTDEVYGDVPKGVSDEEARLDPRSPYAASKAGADLVVRAYHVTYGLPACITRSSNNFGPYQYPEKIVPLFITNAIDSEPLPVYGDGLQVRDWLYVEDNCAAIELILQKGEPGEVYNVGGDQPLTNLELTAAILERTGRDRSLVRLVPDRPGHDRRYAVDSTKIRALGWEPAHELGAALTATVRWYTEHVAWWRPLKDGAYRNYYERQYAARLAAGTPAETV